MQRIVPISVADDQLDFNSFKEIRFKHHKILYNTSGVIYNYMFFPFDIHHLIVADNVLYMQTACRNIYKCNSLLNFTFMCPGEIVGKFRNALVVSNGDAFNFLYKNIQITFGFFLVDDSLVLSHDLNLIKPVVKSHICYKKYFAFFSEASIYLFDQHVKSDSKFLFPGPIQSYAIKELCGIHFLLVYYMDKQESRNCLIYINQIVAHDIYISSEAQGESLLFNISNALILPKISDKAPIPYTGNNISKLFKSLFNTKDSEVYRKSRKDLRSYKIFDDLKRNSRSSVFTKNIKVHSEVGYVHSQLAENLNMSSEILSANQHTFYLDDLEKKAFALNNSKSRKDFLINFFHGNKTDIFTPVFIQLANISGSVEKLIDLIGHKVTNSVVNILKNLKYEKWFYFSLGSLEDLNSTRKNIKNLFKLSHRYSLGNHEVLNRTYTRVFSYSPLCKNTENLAYKVIGIENQFYSRLNLEKKLISDQYRSSDRFLYHIQKFHGNSVMQEMIAIFSENSIALHADITDLNNYRQNTFLQRTLFNIGLLLINPNFVSKSNVEELSIKINATNFIEKLTPENLFFFIACSSPYYFSDLANSPSILSMAQKYAKSLLRDINDEELEEFIREVPDKKKNLEKFLILCLSNIKKTDKNEKSVLFNKILKAHINDLNLDLRLSSIVALAKFNYETDDHSIIDILSKEISRCGPTNCDKTNVFFDSYYRNIAAISLALVSTKPFYAYTNFSFTNLIVLGLTSIGKKTDSSFFYRSEDCLVEELFYSELFTLLSDFSTDPLMLVHEVMNENFATEIVIYKAAAKLFYVGLYVVYKSDFSSSDTLVKYILEFAEKIEDQAYLNKTILILFNYALVAVSIIRSGTCDLAILKILRRQFLNTKNIKKMHSISFFDKSKKTVENIKGIDQVSMQFYKICIGLVCANFGLSRLKRSSVKQLVVTFFLSHQISYEFSYYDVLRGFIVRSLEPFEANVQLFKNYLVKNKAKKKTKTVMEMFEKEFFHMPEIDKKFVVDVLSDYFENHNKNLHMGSVFDLKALALLLLNCK